MSINFYLIVALGIVMVPVLLVAPSLILDYFAKKRGEM